MNPRQAPDLPADNNRPHPNGMNRSPTVESETAGHRQPMHLHTPHHRRHRGPRPRSELVSSWRTRWSISVSDCCAAADLTRLGRTATDRSLYRHAAALLTAAASLGNTDATAQLITHLSQASPSDTARAAQWAVNQVSLNDPRRVTMLLGVLREAGAGEAVTTLADRAADQVSLNDPRGVADLLRALREAGAGEAVTALLARDPRYPGQPRQPVGRRRAGRGAAGGGCRRRGHHLGRPGR